MQRINFNTSTTAAELKLLLDTVELEEKIIKEDVETMGLEQIQREKAEIMRHVNSVLSPFAYPISNNHNQTFLQEEVMRAFDFAVTFEDKICIESLVCKYPEKIIPEMRKRKDPCLNFLYEKQSTSEAAKKVQSFNTEAHNPQAIEKINSKKRVNSRSRSKSCLMFTSPRINKNTDLPDNFSEKDDVEKVIYLLLNTPYDSFQKHATVIFLDLGKRDKDYLNKFAKIVLKVDVLNDNEKKKYFKFIANFIDKHNSNQLHLTLETLGEIADSIIALASGESKESLNDTQGFIGNTPKTNSYYEFVLQRADTLELTDTMQTKAALKYLNVWEMLDELEEAKSQNTQHGYH